ncbi:MAG: type IV pilus twitching motility protein PilT [Candidatus Eiseniibacteriota bacterium]|nr:MAG: type IV pilus twitching motility protein PilT [Candidatus Eisenbacteria bacterium]
MNIIGVLEKMSELNASDLHLKVGSPPVVRVDGTLQPLDMQGPNQEELVKIADQILTPRQKRIFDDTKEVDFGFGVPGLSRFRCNFYVQRGTICMVFRRIPFSVPGFEELALPAAAKDLSMSPRGLILVTGTVGSGKSTTLAAMIENINATVRKSIITIEDPVEFLVRDKKSVISQREVGMDTLSFGEGLKHILRQDPDVILIGEIRDVETMSIALMAADTGHLVLSTLHTTDAAQTVNRVISFYQPHQHEEVRFMLASNLRAVISMRLIPRADGHGRVPAVEIMVCTAAIREYIVDAGKTPSIRMAIQEGVSQYGMQTFDQAIMQLYRKQLITLENALKFCTNPSEFSLRVKGIEATSDKTWEIFEGGGAKH